MGFTVRGQETNGISMRSNSADNGWISRTAIAVVTVLVSVVAVMAERRM